MLVPFDPPCDVPDRFPSPFAREPHPLARHAAELLRPVLPALAEGKMFGVLVVRAPDGRIGYLAAFSGMLDGHWHVPGFVPPLFDDAARAAFWPAGEAELGVLAARLAALDTAPHTALAALDATHAAELTALRARHRANRATRHAARVLADGDAAFALDGASRADTAEKRRLLASHATARAPLAAAVAAIDAERRALEDERAAMSRRYLHALFDTYRLANARGELQPLRGLFAPAEPPGGAGDCAAPKLLGYAYRCGLQPLALAELWWGPPPATGGRHHGVFYPACRGKCGPLLAHMLDGLDAEPAPVFATAVGDDEPRIVFEDAWLVIVDKPAGLLSVPGRSGALRDSVQTRLARRLGGEDVRVVHRLDLDVSGVMLVAKHAATYVALQRLFATREVDKHYVAWLDGEVAADSGVVDLALRVDLEDRPRQIHDPVHGKPARTAWRVIGRSSGLTKVELVPHTGRTHQLRVHAAHPRGIGAPIVGDPLYGRPQARLQLHAERLAFTHPHTRQRVEVSRIAPF